MEGRVLMLFFMSCSQIVPNKVYDTDKRNPIYNINSHENEKSIQCEGMSQLWPVEYMLSFIVSEDRINVSLFSCFYFCPWTRIWNLAAKDEMWQIKRIKRDITMAGASGFLQAESGCPVWHVQVFYIICDFLSKRSSLCDNQVSNTEKQKVRMWQSNWSWPQNK